MRLWLFFMLVISAPVLAAPESEGEEPDVAEGHSYHGEVFNEGPRQSAVRIEGTGDVHFPVTTSSELAQGFFDQGIGQLHGYWDFEAERSFRQVASLDPDCAMAYWGMAMANFKNATRANGFIEEALKRRELVTEKERMWIDGLGQYFNGSGDNQSKRRKLTESLCRIVSRDPDDIEAKAFLMRQLYQNSRKGVPFESHESVDRLAREIFEVNPAHPVHHYVIHLWDHKKPSNALPSSEACGPSAPAIAHMWHMPGHIYTKLHRHNEAAWYLEASARVDHAHTIKYQFLPDQIHNYRHNNAWLANTLSHVGRCDDATALAMNMVELPRVPVFRKKGDGSTYNSAKSSWRSGRERLKKSLLRFEQWDRILALKDSPYLSPDGSSIRESELAALVAIAHYERGEYEAGEMILKRLVEQLEQEKSSSDRTMLETAIRMIRCFAALNLPEPDFATAKNHLSGIKFNDLEKALQAWLYTRIGDHAKSVKLAEEAVNSAKNQVHPLAVQVHALHAAGKKDESRVAFDVLRKAGGNADLHLPVMRRLSGIAREFGFPGDWRIPGPPPQAVEFASLGPFRWTPPQASRFALEDYEGTEYRLSERAGRNTLVIFYLGKGCTHCMEQLNAFAPVLEDFRAAGIEILAISTDTPSGLADTFVATGEQGGKSPFPFPLLSNADLDVFKQYRAFDDFEDLALHGTFLIDGDLTIRWQDIGHEPFMYPGWLLEECVRLLAVDRIPPHLRPTPR